MDLVIYSKTYIYRERETSFLAILQIHWAIELWLCDQWSLGTKRVCVCVCVSVCVRVCVFLA